MCGVLLAARMGLKQLVQDAGEFESISGTEHREEVLSLCAALLPYSAVQFSAGLGQSDLNGTPVIRIGAARHQIRSLADAAPVLRTPRSASVSAACPPRFLGPLLLGWKCHLRARDFLHLQEMTRSWVVVSDG